MLLFVYYSTILDSTDISILSKDKISISTNNIKIYNKKVLNDKICRLIIANVQLMIDKMEIEKAKINLEIDKVQLFDKKNSLVVKRKEFRTEIIVLNAARLSNILIRRY